ncbi:MAG: GNAT family N-acetyltransferase [Bacteroidetes bacterium]|nr:MAG: GNAT family N-acetyltransferase [Bacteroidota bacterium]
MNFSGFSSDPLIPGKEIFPFDYGNTDINEFLIDNAGKYLLDLAVTYLIEQRNLTTAYYCVSNDKISAEEIGSSHAFERWRVSKFPGIRLRDYPAVKNGRLGVSNEFKRIGLGTFILDYVKELAINLGSGCRFITVDAKIESIEFYQKNRFEFLTPKDEGKETRQMYFDLLKLTER